MAPENLNVATALENYAGLLRKTKREAQAAEMEARAQAIRARHAQRNPKKRLEKKGTPRTDRLSLDRT